MFHHIIRWSTLHSSAVIFTLNDKWSQTMQPANRSTVSEPLLIPPPHPPLICHPSACQNRLILNSQTRSLFLTLQFYKPSEKGNNTIINSSHTWHIVFSPAYSTLHEQKKVHLWKCIKKLLNQWHAETFPAKDCIKSNSIHVDFKTVNI